MRHTPRVVAGAAVAGYLPALDGIRAVSILLVVFSHFGAAVLPGAFGVTLFFFISGYLITGQLLHGLQTAGRIDFAGFYLRRGLRLLPAGLAYIVVSGLVFQAMGGRLPAAAWAAALFYGANYAAVWGLFRSSLPHIRDPFNILWSLAVEEHFYAIWPAALALLRRRRRAIVFVLGICAAALLWRLWLLHACFADGTELAGPHGAVYCGPANPNPLGRFNRIYFGTDTRLDSLAWGALMALLDGRVALAGSGRALAGLLLLALSFADQAGWGRHGLRSTEQGIALLALLPWLLHTSAWPNRLLCLPAVVLIGRLSYSLYLWHWLAMMVADWAEPVNDWLWRLVALPLACVLAAASYWGIERPMLRLRRRAGSHAA